MIWFIRSYPASVRLIRVSEVELVAQFGVNLAWVVVVEAAEGE
jgi:hypothetical protein